MGLPRRIITPAILDAMLKLRRQGAALAEIARATGFSSDGVSKAFARARAAGDKRAAYRVSTATVETAGAGHFVPGIPAPAAQFPERITVRLPEHVARHAGSLEARYGMSREAALREAMRVEAAKGAAAVHNSTMERKRP